MKKGLAILTCALVLSSCGTAEKKEEKSSAREFKLDYSLVEASDADLPEWIKKPESGDTSKERKINRYFVNESSNTEKRLCLKSAEARATARISAEIAQYMKNAYSEATQNSEDEATEFMQEQLAQESQSFIVGSTVLKTYWEKRAYKEELGAEEDKTTYNCFALVKMSKKDLQNAVKQARQKLLGTIEDPEVKQKAEKVLNDISEKFAEHDEKVEVKGSEE